MRAPGRRRGFEQGSLTSSSHLQQVQLGPWRSTTPRRCDGGSPTLSRLKVMPRPGRAPARRLIMERRRPDPCITTRRLFAVAAAQSASVVVRRWYPNGSCRRGDTHTVAGVHVICLDGVSPTTP
jgi:hypothetical protein